MENKFSEGLTKVFKHSKSEAKRLHSEFLSTEHFLLGIIQTDNSAKEILENLTTVHQKLAVNLDDEPPTEQDNSIPF